jgi:hypothetical protein
LATLNRSHAYTLDLITTKAGFASWIALDDVSIPGIPLASSKVKKGIRHEAPGQRADAQGGGCSVSMGCR